MHASSVKNKSFCRRKLHFLKCIFISLTFIASSSFSQQRPNILVIISDDHAYQTISAYGSKFTSTPAIDRIAREGAIFNSAYVTNSICGPSRAVFLTGKYSHKNGFRDNENSTFDFSQPTFTKSLQAAGYQTAWIGKMHLGDNAPEGFDYYNILPGQGQYYNPDFITKGQDRKQYPGYVTNIISDLAEQWLDDREKEKPFCLVIGHKATHRTWMPDLQDLDRFEQDTFPLPSDFYDDYATRKAAAVQDMTIEKTMLPGYDLKMFRNEQEAEEFWSIKRMDSQQRKTFLNHYQKIYDDFTKQHLSGRKLTEWKYQRYMRDYLATAASLDRNIGRILNYLDEKELTNNTILIYLSDQGFYMGEHGWFDKRFMYEESFRTPMVMRYPGLIIPGTKVDEFIMNTDLAPTLLAAAKAPVPDDMQGQSFLPLLSGSQYIPRDAMYYHYYENGEHAVSPHFGIRTKRYKLIRFYKRVESWELFDLKNDPHELHNIYQTAGGRKLAKKLKPKLEDLIKRYQDDDAQKTFDMKIE